MDTHTFDQALTSARQLPPRERARLIAQLVEELAAPAPFASVVHDMPVDALADLEQLINDAAAAGPAAVDSADLVSEMRR